MTRCLRIGEVLQVRAQALGCPVLYYESGLQVVWDYIMRGNVIA